MIWISVGIVSVSLGTVGIFLPLIPTVPLYHLASFSFLRSSERLLMRFKKGKLYKKYLSPYLAAGGLTLRTKAFLIIFVTLQIIVAVFLLVKYIAALLGVVFTATSLFLENPVFSSVLGVTGCSCFWSIRELFEQRERVKKGWFPENPKKKNK